LVPVSKSPKIVNIILLPVLRAKEAAWSTSGIVSACAVMGREIEPRRGIGL
jgi:hypothetical protein